MDVSFQIDHEILVIAIAGKVDSVNAPQMEEKIREIVKAHPMDSIVLDLAASDIVSQEYNKASLRHIRDISTQSV